MRLNKVYIDLSVKGDNIIVIKYKTTDKDKIDTLYQLTFSDRAKSCTQSNFPLNATSGFYDFGAQLRGHGIPLGPCGIFWPVSVMDGRTTWGYNPTCVNTHHQNSRFHNNGQRSLVHKCSCWTVYLIAPFSLFFKAHWLEF